MANWQHKIDISDIIDTKDVEDGVANWNDVGKKLAERIRSHEMFTNRPNTLGMCCRTFELAENQEELDEALEEFYDCCDHQHFCFVTFEKLISEEQSKQQIEEQSKKDE